MNKRQQKALQRYVDSLLPMLGLADWQVNVRSDRPCQDNHVATIWPVFGTRAANLRVGKDFFTSDPCYQREIVIHELLHCVFAVTQHQVEIVLPDHMETGAKLFHDLWSQAHEYAIDGLAVAVAPRFPLPRFPQ